MPPEQLTIAGHRFRSEPRLLEVEFKVETVLADCPGVLH